MKPALDRRSLLKLIGVGGVVFASRLARAIPGNERKYDDFFFLQLSDTHWGFEGAPNPQAGSTLKETLQAINSSAARPDFIIFTGDLTHTTDDAALRRRRMKEFKAMVADLKISNIKYIPGEHDAALDRGEAYQELFGPLHYAFDHKGIHFMALDNVSDPNASIGEEQIEWLKADLARVDAKTPIVVFAHRPLFDLYPSWDWSTRDGAQVIEALEHRPHVTVFYGHIHQEHAHRTGKIEHHAARSLMFALPAPGSVPKKAPVAWDPAHPKSGLGYRAVAFSADGTADRIRELEATMPATFPRSRRPA